MILSQLLQNVVIYAFTGAFAGMMAGILGIGGGIIIVPALAHIFSIKVGFPNDLAMQFAAGTSLAIMMVSAQQSLRVHFHQHNILWSVYKKIAPGLVVGTIAGAIAADLLPSRYLKLIFAFFLLAIATNMYLGRKTSKDRQFPTPFVNALISFSIGLQAGMLGLGGGILVVPYLTYCGLELRRITAVSSLCTMTAAIVGALAYILTGSNEPGLPLLATGYVFWPAVLWVALPSALFAPIGASLTYRLPEDKLKLGFIVFLLIVALDMLASLFL